MAAAKAEAEAWKAQAAAEKEAAGRVRAEMEAAVRAAEEEARLVREAALTLTLT